MTILAKDQLREEGGAPKSFFFLFLVALLMEDQELFTDFKTLKRLLRYGPPELTIGPYAGIFINLYREIQIFGDQK